MRALKGPPSRPRLAAVMDRIRAYLVQSVHPHRDVVWAICCTAFFGFFRLGELLPVSRAQITPAVSLMWGDVAVDSRERPTMVRVHLKKSKCDQFGAGADIILGRTGLPLCPVVAILKFIEIRGSSAGPFFRGSDAQPVLKAWFVEQLRDILAAVGLSMRVTVSASVRPLQLPSLAWHPDTGRLAQRSIPAIHQDAQ